MRGKLAVRLLALVGELSGLAKAFKLGGRPMPLIQVELSLHLLLVGGEVVVVDEVSLHLLLLGGEVEVVDEVEVEVAGVAQGAAAKEGKEAGAEGDEA